MVETFVAAADLVTAIPSTLNDLKWPIGLLVAFAGTVIAGFRIHKGAASAFGIMLIAMVMGAAIIGSSGLLATIKQTLDNHSGITTGQYGR